MTVPLRKKTAFTERNNSTRKYCFNPRKIVSEVCRLNEVGKTNINIVTNIDKDQKYLCNQKGEAFPEEKKRTGGEIGFLTL